MAALQSLATGEARGLPAEAWPVLDARCPRETSVREQRQSRYPGGRAEECRAVGEHRRRFAASAATHATRSERFPAAKERRKLGPDLETDSVRARPARTPPRSDRRHARRPWSVPRP